MKGRGGGRERDKKEKTCLFCGRKGMLVICLVLHQDAEPKHLVGRERAGSRGRREREKVAMSEIGFLPDESVTKKSH